ncbi:MAG: hypothetical protein M1840_003000 [Geoglossum simile]|nr:MAG: hypothetical protein M1840_003000 [Geoglossum simile]
MFNNREEGGRGPHLLPAPEEEAGVGGDAVHESRRIERYRDEEEADEEIDPTRHNAENGSGTSPPGRQPTSELRKYQTISTTNMSPSNTVPTARLDRKVALITGAGRGISAGIALELAKRRANIVVNYASSAGGADKVVNQAEELGQKAIAIKADITNPEEITTMFEKAKAHFGRIDFVISNSGREAFYPAGQVTPQQYDDIFALNTCAQFFIA